MINPGDGKGPRIWCGWCKAYVPAEQEPWPGHRYRAKKHKHVKAEGEEGA